MPSIVHEAVLQLIRDRPSLVTDLLAGALDVPVPAHEAIRLEPADCTDLTPTEYRADQVVTLRRAEQPVLAVVVEVQLHRNRRKRRSWPVYVTTVYARMDCPATLLVVCLDEATAAWCATPIDIGPGMRLTPLVLGPGRVPTVAADAPEPSAELAVLAALTHGADPARRRVLDGLVEALAAIEPERAILYAQLVLAALPEAARGHLEALMSLDTFEYHSDWTRQIEARGAAKAEARGEANALLTVLEARGVEVPADVRERVTACSDVAVLTSWLRRAVTVASADELFD